LAPDFLERLRLLQTGSGIGRGCGVSGNCRIGGGYGVPLQILRQTQMTKSAFFPITPAPSRLVLNYATGGDLREISLDLPDLSGLHLRAPQVKASP
jgi:hypothetical protein